MRPRKGTMKFPLLTATLAFLTTYQWSPQFVSAAKCTITKYNADDIKRAQSQCSRITIDGIEVPAGETLALTQLVAGTTVIFSGKITWDYMEWKGPLLSVFGVNIEIIGTAGHVLDGRGYMWWDGKGENGGKVKPKFFEVKLTNGRIHNLKIKNSPLYVFSIVTSNDMVIRDVTIDNSVGGSRGALNTDAFEVHRSSDLRIHSCTVFNQDNCLAIRSGSNMRFFDNYCSGGAITIGSVGDTTSNSVSDVAVSNCEITNSDSGVRIKAAYGAGGSISNIRYQDITLSSIHKYGIVIEGDYKNGIPTGIPTTSVHIGNLKVNNVHGTVDSSGANIYVFVASASDWGFTNINVTGGTKNVTCRGIPSSARISCESINSYTV